MHSRLTRWVNRVSPFNFKIRHYQEKKWDLPVFLNRDQLQEKPFYHHITTTNSWLPQSAL